MEISKALSIVRILIDSGITQDEAINNPAIPNELHEKIKEILIREENFVLEPARILSIKGNNEDWLSQIDQSNWYYWPTLKTYLIVNKNWSQVALKSLDETTDRILRQLANPTTAQFDMRGLVIGYVQSGKTANFTSLIAKAADVGYRLIIVLSGIDNGLRRQTQIRLNRELVGYVRNRVDSVPLPPRGKQWHQFTSEDFNGDFRPGFANYAALQGTQPVLLVVKKNGTVLRKLHRWLDSSPEEVRENLPFLLIDDEADQASVDTKGSYQAEGQPIPVDFEEPSVINGLIRDLLHKFQRKAYVAYTATPFANILIPHDTFNPTYKNDLYPKDFIVDLPKPIGYFGAEEQFGRFDSETGSENSGLDIIRNIPDKELDDLQHIGLLPPTLETAILEFCLAGAAKSQRGLGNSPATMLLHGSHLVLNQLRMAKLIQQKVNDLQNEWRYQRSYSLLTKLALLWEQEFQPITKSIHPEKVVLFSQIEPFLNSFINSLQVNVINSASGKVLDYETEPTLKSIAVGGNKLSRGLTLEGLLISYFFRSSSMYDTLMQMGRWFGFKDGYEDLTRIFMTRDIAGWFNDLAMVEYEIRQDIKMYEAQNLTPLELGTRIVKHPAMLVTSRLKQRYARSITIEQSYSNQILQTFRFPFRQKDNLSILLGKNQEITKNFIKRLSKPNWEKQNPIWRNVPSNQIIEYLRYFMIDSEVRNISLPLIIDYMERQNGFNELLTWIVAIKGREKLDIKLGSIDLDLERPLSLISRTRLKSDEDSLGVITSPGDELVGLTKSQIQKAKEEATIRGIAINRASRFIRSPNEGLLLIYPISKYSGKFGSPGRNRQPLFEDSEDPRSKDIICLAISFPKANKDQGIKGEYVIGTVDWKPL